jgi:hypothetical protein
VWNTPIDYLPVDPKSSAYITTIGTTKGLHPDFGTIWEGAPIGIPYTIVPGSQPKVGITFYYDDESDPGPYPIPPDAAIEGGTNLLATGMFLCWIETIVCSTKPLLMASGGWKLGAGSGAAMISAQ